MLSNAEENLFRLHETWNWGDGLPFRMTDAWQIVPVGVHIRNRSLAFNRSRRKHIIKLNMRRAKLRLIANTNVSALGEEANMRMSVISESDCGRVRSRDNRAYCPKFRTYRQPRISFYKSWTQQQQNVLLLGMMRDSSRVLYSERYTLNECSLL